MTGEDGGFVALRARLTVARDFVFKDVLGMACTNCAGAVWADEVVRREAARVVTGMSMVYDRVYVHRERQV